MKLSKTDFANYLACSKNFWLRHRKPELHEWPAPSAMHRTRMMEGQEVERASAPYVQAIFGTGLSLQATYETDTLIARADFVRSNADGSIDIIEVKASTKLKDSEGNDHVADVAFQWLTASRAGQHPRSAHIILLNGDYARGDEVDVMQLFEAVDVTEEVMDRLQTLEAEVDEAVAFLSSDDVDLDGCDCQFRGANSRCDAFAILNPSVASDSAHYLPGIRRNKLENWAPTFDLRTIPADQLSPHHKLIQSALLSDAPVIDREAICDFLADISYPIYFYDYETTGPAVPPATGYRPYQAIPVQFSIHRLDADGSLHHFEWLAEGHGRERDLVMELEALIGKDGSAMAWHKSFELSCNDRLARLHPDKRTFLDDLSARTIDLEVPFKKSYVDWGFRGSSSIKKVLPVLVPELQYATDAVHDGTGAVEAWSRMIDLEPCDERAELRRQLLAYCELDTLAMVRIFDVLRKAAR